MPDRLDQDIQALVVELIEASPPPPLASEVLEGPRPPATSVRSGLLRLAATAAAVLAFGGMAFLVGRYVVPLPPPGVREPPVTQGTPVPETTAAPTTSSTAQSTTTSTLPAAQPYDADGRARRLWVSAQGRGYVVDLVEGTVDEITVDFDPLYGVVLADGSLILSTFDRAELLIRRSGETDWEPLLAEEGSELWMAGYQGGPELDLFTVRSDAQTRGVDYLGEQLLQQRLEDGSLTEVWSVEGLADRVSVSADRSMVLLEIFGPDPVYGPIYEVREGETGEPSDLPQLPRTQAPDDGSPPSDVVWGVSLLGAEQAFFHQTPFGGSTTESFIRDLASGQTIPAKQRYPGLPDPEPAEPAFFAEPVFACRYDDRVLDVRNGVITLVDLVSGERTELLDTGHDLDPSC